MAGFRPRVRLADRLAAACEPLTVGSIERDLALSDFTQDESESYNGREVFSNAIDPEAVLNQLVAPVMERRADRVDRGK